MISRSAVNQVTLKVQQQLDSHRQASITQTPAILIVDGVWVDVQYTLDAYKLDRSGHQRQCRQAEERVILAALAVWADGTHEMLHYEIAKGESEAEWNHFFQQLIARGLNPETIKLVVSDGTLGLPKALKQQLPQAQQQRCITHKAIAINSSADAATHDYRLAQLQEAFFIDLAALEHRTVVTLDTYQMAIEPLQKWIESQWLRAVERQLENVVSVVAGQSIPDPYNSVWGDECEHFPLKPIIEVTEWCRFCSDLPEEAVKAIMLGGRGHPANVHQMLSLAVQNWSA